ncbi:PREDICTED: sodium/calcium exchanger 1-like, partial [Priapulus caudatus]|uniref:Sodium/calcium exchanger 1-like n=1 Tax=Priapulus caudatus TaxID=37621 RepID=A0ABM1E787_PRICU
MENFSMEMRYDVGDCPNYNCSAKGLLLPIICEYTWTPATRAALYLIGLFYSFLGVAIVADIFMCSIEMITSKTTKIKVAIPNTNETEEVEVKVWNGTVANLTLMALGLQRSLNLFLLLSIIEIVGNDFQAGQLGPGTIVGSAAFNLLVIIAVCVAVIPDDEGRRINHVKVFFVTAFSSLFAYIWLYIILSVNTKGVVDVWEAILTLMFFPILVIIAYVADRDFCGRKVSVTMSALELGIKIE